MAVTQIIRFKAKAPYTLTTAPVPRLFHQFCRRQSAHSAYPVLYYSDDLSPTLYHVITGWHSVDSFKQWAESSEEKEVRRILEPMLEYSTYICVGMPFDAFPRGSPGVLAVTYVPTGTRDHMESESESESESEDEDEDKETGGRLAGTRESPVTIAWMGGGEILSLADSQKTEGFCRFVLYEGDVSSDTIQKQHKTPHLSILRRITIPRA